MGIKHLNRYLLDECGEHSIRNIHFSEFSNQIVIIDTSIYMYKFLERDALLENMYLFISIFKKYNITPVFIFDGKPPPEKKDVLEQRKTDKKNAEEKFQQLQQKCEELEETQAAAGAAASQSAILELKTEMDELKKQFIRIKDSEFSLVKQLMTAYGIMYIESMGEADQLCSYLVKHNYAWACVSDDMDMFLYGCPRVLRHVNLIHHTAMLYDTMRILKDLNINLKTFKEILVLSGTDYNQCSHTSLHETLRYYIQYMKTSEKYTMEFYDWLQTYTDYIKDRVVLDKIYGMFDLSMFVLNNNKEIKNIIQRLPFKIGKTNMDDLKQIMRQDGFIFV